MNGATMTEPLLDLRGLRTQFTTKRGVIPAVDEVSIRVGKGESVGIVGESGCGKSVTLLSLLRLVSPPGRIVGGSARFCGEDLLSLSERGIREIRGRDIAMIFQEPMTSLNPVYTIGKQVAESLRYHRSGLGAREVREAVTGMFARVGMSEPEKRYEAWPHQLSGGLRQRAMIAMALICRPKLLIADEPTTALDVTIQAQILALIRELQKEFGMTVIFITHDMGVVAEMADDVVVMRKGRLVESGAVRDIFRNPKEAYTKALLAAVPRLGSMRGQELPRKFPLSDRDGESVELTAEAAPQDTARYDSGALLCLSDLVVRFDVKKNLLGRTTHRVHAVEKVSFNIYPGETLALVGESGSGKSTIGRAIQQLQRANSGDFSFEGRALSAMGAEERRSLQQRIQYIFQDPFASLDPRRTVGYSISEPICVHALLKGEGAIRARVAELLARVGLDASHATRYPHELSGGQRQRVCIARALASRPKLIIADEALSAMDVSIQAQIINLFMELQKEEGIAYLFISHDMAVVERISHRVAVLYRGQIVEIGKRSHVFENPLHAYTRRLLLAVPVADPDRRGERQVAEGELLSQIRHVDDLPKILGLREAEPGHFVAE